MLNISDSKAGIFLKVLRFQEKLNTSNAWPRTVALCVHFRACRT